MKTKKIRIKQGFTIVELVIVIGVIGVLSAILIPTFINLTNKANEASNQSFVKNLNTEMAIREQEKGKKNATMADAVLDAREIGFDVEKLTPVNGRDLVWDSTTNRFALLNNDGTPFYSDGEFKATGSQIWKIYDSMPTGDQTFSIFAKTGWNTTAVTGLKTGFDVGFNTNIESIAYENDGAAKDVVIRTGDNGTTLTVNAPKDTVRHYNHLESLTVTAIANESYHEYGTIAGKTTLSQGHIEIEEGAEVREIHVESVPAGKTAKVTAKEETVISVDPASSDKTAVVAESDNVYVSGIPEAQISGSKASDVELPTVISSEAELTTAVSTKKAYLQLGADFSVAKTFELNYKALFDFAGFTVTSTYVGTTNEAFKAAIDALDPEFEYVNSPFILNKNSLTFIDSKQNGGVTSANNLVVLNEGTLTVNGGRFESTMMLHKDYSQDNTTEAQDEYMATLGYKRGVIRNEKGATCVINGGEVSVASDYGVYSKGDLTINGGTFVSTSNSTNGTAYAYCVSSGGGTMVINGGEVTGQHGAIAVNGGTAVINNVHAETKKGTPAKGYYRALYIAGEVGVAGVEINGGYFKSYNMEALLTGNKNDGGVGALAMTNIHGGTFVNGLGGTNPAVKVSYGKGQTNYGLGIMTIDGGKFSSNVSDAAGVKTCVQGEDGLWVVNA